MAQGAKRKWTLPFWHDFTQHFDHPSSTSSTWLDQAICPMCSSSTTDLTRLKRQIRPITFPKLHQLPGLIWPTNLTYFTYLLFHLTLPSSLPQILSYILVGHYLPVWPDITHQSDLISPTDLTWSSVCWCRWLKALFLWGWGWDICVREARPTLSPADRGILLTPCYLLTSWIRVVTHRCQCKFTVGTHRRQYKFKAVTHWSQHKFQVVADDVRANAELGPSGVTASSKS